MPFGEPALHHFLYLERPEALEDQHAEGFVPGAPPRTPVEADEIMPRGQEYSTVGRLYRGIADGLRNLVELHGEEGVFIGLPTAQATPERFHWPQVIAVTDLESALAAVAQIIEQGEGARGDWHDAHYGRFLGMWEEFHELKRKDPAFEPARPVVPAFHHQPFDIAAPQILISDPLTGRIAEVAALAYEVVLHMLLRYFTHTDEDEKQLTTLVNSAIDLMVSVLRPLGVAMTSLPVGPQHPGVTAGFPFEMYYVMTNAVPARRTAWILLHERVALLAQGCAALADEEPGVPGVRAAAEKAAEVVAAVEAAGTGH
jgi:hypothetical protein